MKKVNRFAATALVTLSVWIAAILINSALMFLLTFAYGSHNYFWEAVGTVLLLSAIFSLPKILIFWWVFVSNCRNENLFVVLLVTACCTSLLSCLVFCLWLVAAIGASKGFELLIIPVLAALAAVVLHRPAIAAVYFVQSSIHPLNNSEPLET